MDYIRSFVRSVLSKAKMAHTDEELGRRTSVYPDGADAARRESGWAESVVVPHIESSEKLMQFRMLVGITTHGSFKAPRGFAKDQRPTITTRGRPAPNRGIYVEVVDREIKLKKSYKFTSILINSCLGLQIIVAAALTALGASDSSHRAVTVFGAVNTVIAGFLTYLKGSGLPSRLKYYQHEYSKVREYIEQRERDLSIDDSINVLDVVNTIRLMYEEVQADVEANRPDRFVGTGAMRNKTIVSPMPPLAGPPQIRRISSAMSEPLREKVNGLHSQMLSTEKEAEAYAVHGGEGIRAEIGHLHSAVQDKMKELAHLERQIVDHGKKAMGRKVHGFEEQVDDRRREMSELGKVVEEDGRETVSNTQKEMEAKATVAVDDVAGRLKATLDEHNKPV